MLTYADGWSRVERIRGIMISLMLIFVVGIALPVLNSLALLVILLALLVQKYKSIALMLIFVVGVALPVLNSLALLVILLALLVQKYK
jgi:hypothetical protein